MNKIFSLRNITVFLLIVTALLLLFNLKQRRQYEVKAENWDKLMLILGQLDQNYVDSINHGKLTETIIPIILESLDPHSIYLPPQERQQAEDALDGDFDGIGIEFNVPNDTAIVVNVISGGPSDKAGLLSGDRIVKVGDKNVAGVKLNQDSLVKLLRGPSGTNVDVGIKRGGSPTLVPFKIKRGKIPVKSIDVAYMVDAERGYIKLSKFSRTSHKEFVQAVKDLKQQGMKELIFDLRGNTGGYLDQALLLSNEFLKKGEMIVYMEGLHRSREEFRADANGSCKDIDLKVLIDENSASSSEIFAGAIQDNDRGTIIGRRSFGKGLVQEPINFTDNSGIRLTVARFYTPSGRSIQKPYSKDYRNDIAERYIHGEMMSADSIKVDSTLKYKTLSGRSVFGGGGITPDIFVPLDTTGVNKYFIKISNLALAFKFSSLVADEFRGELKTIKNLEALDLFYKKIGIENRFLRYLESKGVKPLPGEWSQCREVAITQVEAYIGRYTQLEDRAFYPIISRVDNVIKVALKREKGVAMKGSLQSSLFLYLNPAAEPSRLYSLRTCSSDLS